jgi:hypothetical protein
VNGLQIGAIAWAVVAIAAAIIVGLKLSPRRR